MQVKLSEIIAPHYHNTFLSKAMHQADEGGRGSTKTSKEALKVAWTAITEEKCAIVVMRKHSNKIRRSVYKEVLRAFYRLGIDSNNLKKTVSPFQITYKPNGNPIYFTGIDSIDDIKGMIDEDRPIKLVWLEELTQFKDEMELLHISATFSRGNDDWFITLYSWNAPDDTYHWIFEWLEKMKTREDFLHTNTTYLTVPPKWLGKMFIQEAEAIKEMDIDLYNHIYLNLPLRLSGMVYKKWNEATHVEADNIIDRNKFARYYIGIDYGETDATTFTLRGASMAWDYTRALRHYYHKNGVTRKVRGLPFIKTVNREKQVDDYVEDLITCAIEWKKEFEFKTLDIWVDSANKTFREMLKKILRQRGITWVRVKSVVKQPHEKDADIIEERITIYNFMLVSGIEKVSNHESTYELRKALSQCKRGEDGRFKGKRVDNGTQNIDSLDGNEYSFIMNYKQIKNSVVKAMTRSEENA